MVEFSESNTQTEFGYSGYLIFIPFETEVQGDLKDIDTSEVESKIIDRLPQFKRGCPDKPGDGFEKTDFQKFAREAEILSEYPELGNTIHVQYVRESYQTILSYSEDGEHERTQAVSSDSTDIFWHYPDFLFLRGPRSKQYDALNRIRSLLIDTLYLEKVEFEPDFFTWILWKYHGDESQEIGNLRSIHDATFSGQQDIIGSISKVSGSVDILSSIPALSEILEGKQITSIEGVFHHRGQDVQAEVGEESIHIKSSKGAVKSMTSIERMGFSISFVSELCRVHSKWKDLPPTRRYPPPKFFESIHKQVLDQGADIEYISDEVLRRYEALRNEEE